MGILHTKAGENVVGRLVAMKHVFIKWPKGNRVNVVTDGFGQKRGVHGVIGAIDGSHIPIRPPFENHENYVNRKSFHSIILQAVCDNELYFTDIYAGWPGSVHNACVYRRPPPH